MWKLLKILEFCHSKGVMHRDLKFSNLILGKKGDFSSLKLIDFGFSQLFNDNKYFVYQCGSPGFIAPEIFLDQKYNEKCDIFSAGVIFYTLKKGEGLFKAKTEEDIL